LAFNSSSSVITESAYKFENRDAGGRSGGPGGQPPKVHVKVKSKLVNHNN
jgi:hypothetical protein